LTAISTLSLHDALPIFPSHRVVCNNADILDRRVVPFLLSTVQYPTGHPLEGKRGVCMGYAIDHEDGLVLFDTGIGTPNPALIARSEEHTSELQSRGHLV